MLDFGAVPPEATSTRIYSGPGSPPMVAAAAAWDSLAAQLNSFAEGYSAAISALEGDGWAGPSANAMAAAAASYVQWVTATAEQAEQVAGQARASAAAFETAHAAVVPPALVAANRIELANLVAGNIFGQNTPQIATTEARYAGMWAQDAQAMYGYAGSAASSAKLTPFGEPPQTTDPAGPSAQAAAAAQAAGSGASHSPNRLTDLLQTLSSPGAAATSSPDTTSLFGLPIPDSLMTDLGDINTILGLPNAAGGGLRSVANVVSMTVALFRLWADTVLYAPLAGLTGATSPVGGLPGGVLAGSATGSANKAVLAGVGGASTVGQVSVPPAWTQATPVATAGEQPLWLSEVESWWEAGAPANLGAQTMAEVAAAAAAGSLLMRPVVGKALRVPPRQFKMSRPSSGG